MDLEGEMVDAAPTAAERRMIMAEYIEREATIKLLRSLGSRYYRRDEGTIQEAIKVASCPKYTPPADVATVRHAKWEVVVGSNGKEYMVCTGCRKQQDLTGVFSYCPNCGAKMDGGED